ncbi:MAG TPA: zinc-binding dehydrogenase [Actinomycetota bacterium]
MIVTSFAEPLVIADVDEPEVPIGWALLDVQASGVCFSDVKTSRGLMPHSADLVLPLVPGHEVAGFVVRTNPPGLAATGSLVTVYRYRSCGRCNSCRRGDEPLCSHLTWWMGFTHPGGFQDRVAVPVDRLISVPDGIDAIHAAPLSCALGTAYRAVVTRGRVVPGLRVVIIGLGGVGIHAAQIAVAAGADVVGFDIHDPTLVLAAGLGIDARRSDDDDAIDAVLDASGGGVDVVVDTVGHGATLRFADRLIREGGRIVGVGYSPTTSLDFATTRFVLGELELVGSRYAHRDDMERVVQLVAAGAVRPIVGLVAGLEQVNDVFTALERGEIVGRAVLDVAGVR